MFPGGDSGEQNYHTDVDKPESGWQITFPDLHLLEI